MASSSSRHFIAATSVFLTISWIALLLRIWVRITKIKIFGWDDALLLISTLIFTALCIIVFYAQTFADAHVATALSFAQLAQLLNMAISIFCLYIMAMVVFKLSLSVFYLRIAIRPWQKQMVYATAALNTLSGIFCFFAVIFNCGTPSQFMSNAIQGRCLPLGTTFGIQLAGGIINGLSGIALALLPVSTLMKAKLPRAVAISTGFILLLGLSGCIVSMVRLHFFNGIPAPTNIFEYIISIGLWSIAECGVCITALSLATLRPLFQSLRNSSLIQGLGSGGQRTTGIHSGQSTNSADTPESILGQWQRIPGSGVKEGFSYRQNQPVEMVTLPKPDRASPGHRITSISPNDTKAMQARCSANLPPIPRNSTASTSHEITHAVRLEQGTAEAPTLGQRWVTSLPKAAQDQLRRIKWTRDGGSHGNLVGQYSGTGRARTGSIRDQPISRSVSRDVIRTPPTEIPAGEGQTQRLPRMDFQRTMSADWTCDMLWSPAPHPAIGTVSPCFLR